MMTSFSQASLKLLIITMTLTALLVQSFAYASKSCEMMANSQHQSHQHDKQKYQQSNVMHHGPHSEHMMHPMKHSATDMHSSQNSDCCNESCACFENACSSLSLVSINNHLSDMSFASESILFIQKSLLNLTTSSLYRPPIFA